jgi:hypothetical protein
MLPNIPIYIYSIFFITILLVLLMFRAATTAKGNTVTGILIAWLLLTGILALKGVFENTSSMPPKIAIVVVVSFAAAIVFSLTGAGKNLQAQVDLRMLTLLHVIRIPVEFALYSLFLYKAVPQLMTFEGRNFDILSGITSPVIFFTCFKGSQVIRKKLFVWWNIAALCLLINIIINAFLSVPLPFQQFAFDQPNIAVLYFPFVWLPCFIVPVVLFCHLAAFKKLYSMKA